LNHDEAFLLRDHSENPTTLTTAQEFIWAGGIEDTFVPQTRAGHRALDEYELIGHYEHWREDLTLTRALGLQALRWGVPWYRVEPRQGEFDWEWTDQVIPYLVEELGVMPIIDLMHYGCPYWLEKGFANPDYPQAVAAFAAAFARRYRQLVRWYTPLNEPLMTALMCGQLGLWPPYLRGARGYARLTIQLVKGMLDTVYAIKEVDPTAVMVHIEATGVSRAGHEDLTPLASEDRARHFLAYDFLTGRVTADHPLFSWLLRHGVSWHDLRAIREQRIELDVIGLNFYPQWSTHELYVNRRGRLSYRRADQEGTGFADLIRAHYERYRAPIMITETSADGSDAVRLAWLRASTGAVRQLRGEGVPVIGYTWFPLFTMIDWRYRFGRRPAEEYRVELGLYRLGGDGAGRWIATPLVEELRGYIADPVSAIGMVGEEIPGSQQREVS
jgi:beta-glucosidase